MDTSNGWIKLHRKLLDSPIFTNSKAIHIWIYLLLKANHKQNTIFIGRKKVEIKKGEFVFGYKQAGKDLGLPKSTIHYWISQFEEEKMVESESNNRFTLIKIKNWSDYQETTQELKANRKREENEPKTNRKQIETNNNDKNVKNDKECKEVSSKEEAKPKEYGNPDINWVLDIFEKIRGFKSQGRQKKDRYCAKHLLNNFEKKQIEYMLRWLEQEEYAPRVGSVEKLWYKKGDIIAGIKDQSTKSSKPKEV